MATGIMGPRIWDSRSRASVLRGTDVDMSRRRVPGPLFFASASPRPLLLR
jgi:hypothetical protein